MCTFKIFRKISADFRHSKAILLIIGIALFSLSPSLSQAQEILRGLSVNPELVKSYKEKKVKQLKAAEDPDSLDLPFVDDFSTTTVYPDQRLWIDKQAYVNTTYAVDPPTIGVATLDALDENGYIYQNASSKPFYADKLTSKPFKSGSINKINSQLYLSFFYQPQGLGYRPLPEDSLIVEFYTPDVAKWIRHKDWAWSGDSLRKFKPAVITIPPEFRKKGFQFRFRNIASLQKAENEPPGTRGNVDQWNIDYVRLDTDTIINDMTFVKPITSLLKSYESMPWSHYLIARLTGIKPTIDVTYRSIGTLSALIKRFFKITELRSDGTITTLDPDEADLLAGQTMTVKTNFGGFEAFQNSNASNFEIKGYLGNTANDIRRENDTVRYIQVFSNYFAYDDGSSEYGYGLNAANDMAAYSFHAYRTDTLTAVGFYFNQTEHDTTLKYNFKLAVWDDKDNHPGKLIYFKSVGVGPKKVKLNQIWNFKLDSGILVNEKFYVGFIQESADFMNIGFDRNNDNHTFLWINSGGLWRTSEKAGSLMIRPVLGKNVQEGPVAVKPIISKQSFGIYPNPADNQIFINTGDYKISKPLLVEVYNITGKLALSTQLYENTLDVSSLANGLYFLKLSGDNLNCQPIKLLIQH